MTTAVGPSHSQSSWQLRGSSWRKRPGEKSSGSTRRLVMRRRDFLTLLGAAVAWPRPVIGQSPSKVYRAFLLSVGAPIADNSSQGAALIRGFTQRGYKLGRNLAFERRGVEGQIDRLPRLVDELAASKVDAIVTFGYPPALACKQATTLPVVVVAVDPVGTGLAESLARPVANLTGISDVSA